MITSRRSFLGAMLAASAGPAIVRVASLMPVKPLEASTYEWWRTSVLAFPAPAASFTEIVTTTLAARREEMFRSLTEQNVFFRRFSNPRLDIFGSPIHSSEI